MSKRDGFWDTLSRDSEGQILWPEDSAQRDALVRDVFGARVVGAVDAMVEARLEVASGNLPMPGSHDYRDHAAFGAVFAGMSEEQRAAVKTLVRGTGHAVIYWMLVKLDSFPGASVDLVATPWKDEATAFPPVIINESEFRYMWNEWVEKFSDTRERG